MKKSSNSSLQNNKKPNPLHKTTYNNNKPVTLSEDYFGTLAKNEKSKPEMVTRYTWKNQNNIQIQVITYGARITSIKIPDKAGNCEDIILGFDSLAGYLFYHDLYFGATLGRYAGKIGNANFVTGDQQFFVSKNDGNDHFNGGFQGFDKTNWVPFVDHTKLILTYFSRDQEEGYPGDLFIQITYELTPINEFKINIKANSSSITPVNLSTCNYFNLAGHEKGEKGLNKHFIAINANCYTRNNKIGEIMNVAHTNHDLQIPRLLQNILEKEVEEKYNQNFCINRGVDQENCFVARISYPRNGRILEIYSNQYGCQFKTFDIKNKNYNGDNNYIKNLTDPTFIFAEKIYEYLQKSKLNEYLVVIINELIKKLDDQEIADNSILEPIFNLFEIETLKAIKEVVDDTHFHEVEAYIDNLISQIEIPDNLSISQFENFTKTNSKIENLTNSSVVKNNSQISEAFKLSKSSHDKNEGSKLSNLQPISEEDDTLQDFKENLKQHLETFVQAKSDKIMGVEIPDVFHDGLVHGKNGCVYKKRGGLCFSTQNYPGAIHNKKFPNVFIKPNETYSHTMVYKFWVQSGDPKLWIKKMQMESDPCLK